jgi:hypothetical protein
VIGASSIVWAFDENGIKTKRRRKIRLHMPLWLNNKVKDKTALFTFCLHQS